MEDEGALPEDSTAVLTTEPSSVERDCPVLGQEEVPLELFIPFLASAVPLATKINKIKKPGKNWVPAVPVWAKARFTAVSQVTDGCVITIDTAKAIQLGVQVRIWADAKQFYLSPIPWDAVTVVDQVSRVEPAKKLAAETEHVKNLFAKYLNTVASDPRSREARAESAGLSETNVEKL